MSKYAKYSIWLAKAIIAIAAAIAFVKFFMTGEDVYAAMFAADVAVFITVVINEGMLELKRRIVVINEGMLELKRRIEIIESKQRGFVSFMKVTYFEQLDCKERVDNLIKTLNGDEQ